MPDAGDQAVRKAQEAAGQAEAAAQRAEKAAKRSTFLLVSGFAFALVGAVLAFALKESDPSVLGVDLRSFGGVLFAAGAILIVATAIRSMGGGGGDCDGGSDSSSIKAISGLLAVLAGVVAVTALAIVTMATLGAKNQESVVAVTSSAFGIISAVIGAYLGIKITADTTAKAGNEAKQAAVSQHEAEIFKQQVAAMERKATETVPAQAGAIKAAGYQAREEAARTPGPTPGVGST